MSSYTLYVSDVDSSITDEKLRDIFSAYGRLGHVTIKKSMKGINDFFYAFIEFDKYEDAYKAQKEMDQKELAGKRLSIKFAKPREQRSYSGPRSFYNDMSQGDRKYDSYRHSPRPRSHSRERGMGDMYSYQGGPDRMYLRERPMGRYSSRDEPPPMMQRDMGFEGNNQQPMGMNSNGMNTQLQPQQPVQPQRRIHRDRFAILPGHDKKHETHTGITPGYMNTPTNGMTTSMGTQSTPGNLSTTNTQGNMNLSSSGTTSMGMPSTQSNDMPNNRGGYSSGYNPHYRRDYDHNPRDGSYQRREERFMSRDDYPMDRGYDRPYESRGGFGRMSRGYNNPERMMGDRYNSMDRMKPPGGYGRRDDMRDSHFSGRGGYGHPY